MTRRRLAQRLLLSACLIAALPYTFAADPPKSASELTRGLSSQPGFIDIWRDTEKGRVLLSVRALDEPFLLLVSLPYGLGSNDVGLDRGMQRDPRLVHFEKRGARLFLVQQNARFIADSANADERASASEAFASAVLWSGDILASDGGKHLIDFSSFLQSDRQGIAAQLTESKQGSYKVDEKRSAVVAEQAKSFPDNTELESILTFEGPGTAQFLRDVAADPTSLSLRQHVSLVRLPSAGFQRRAYHPYSGGLETSYFDFGTPLAASIDVHWQARHRLEKTDPGQA
ncbi:MAG: DUF5117 domain-containing protein, partial [Pseudomonadota bacterium]|nr:DUF5117 domain-containing protein [Pseudomonadota bacterium]